VYTEIVSIWIGFINTKSCSNSSKVFFACRENSFKEYKYIRRIRHEYLLCMENTPIDITLSLFGEFSTKTYKNQILNHLRRHDRMGQKTIPCYCLFKFAHISRYCCFLFINRKTKGPTKLVVIKSGLDVRGYFKIYSYLAFHFSLSFCWKQGKLF
jgi:hypothetical protein